MEDSVPNESGAMRACQPWHNTVTLTRVARRVALGLSAQLALAALATAQAPTTTGRIEGRVVLSGAERPSPRLVENTTDPDVCGRVKSLEDLVVSSEGGVAHVIVALIDVPAAFEPAGDRPSSTQLDNRECQFQPHSIVLKAGDTLRLHNSDPTLHTIHWYGPRQANIAMPAGTAPIERRFSHAGMYQIKCDVHGWMQAFVRVDSHRYHAVSDREGRFSIEGVPPGTYSLEAWHERLGTLREQVFVRASDSTELRLIYKLDSR